MPAGIYAQVGWLATVKIGTFIAYGFGAFFFAAIFYSIFKTVYQTKSLESFGEFFTLAIMLLICFIWFNLGLY